MVIWFPEPIRYGHSVGAVEIVCPGCREQVVADVHEKTKSSGKVGRCRLCGFFAALPDSFAPVTTDDRRFLSPNSQPAQVAPFVTVIGSPYEAILTGGTFQFTKELALLGAIAITLKWQRERVFWSRTIFAIILACVIGFILVAVAVATDLAWLAYPAIAGCVIGVIVLHGRLVSARVRRDLRTRVENFTTHFGVSTDDLVRTGIRESGDFKVAGGWLRKNSVKLV
jgi:predicted RNA-binding Zn-ribbon protein involved in translation (DUF1610 family)